MTDMFLYIHILLEDTYWWGTELNQMGVMNSQDKLR
jgi:hypothetical protein